MQTLHQERAQVGAEEDEEDLDNKNDPDENEDDDVPANEEEVQE